MCADTTCRRDRPDAFTLIELLVVVAIIGLLISILLPSLHNARRQAKAVKCTSHLHSLGKALQMYASDYHDYIPRANANVDGYPYAVPLVLMLGVEIDREKPRLAVQFGDIESLQCTDFPDGAIDPESGRVIPEQTLDFVVNNFPKRYTPAPLDEQFDEPNEDGRWRADGSAPEGRPETLSQVPNISGIVYLAPTSKYLPSGYENGRTAQRFLFHDFWRGSQLPRGRFPRVASDPRHPGGINMLYFDGHAGATRRKAVGESNFYFPGL